MKRISTLLVALSLPTFLIACGQDLTDDVFVSDADQVIAELDVALEIEGEAEGDGPGIAACIEDLAFCLADGAEGCKQAFAECMPKLGKKHQGKGGKHPKADLMGADVDAAVDSVDEGAAKPGKGFGGQEGEEAAPPEGEGPDGVEGEGGPQGGPNGGGGGIRGCIRDMVECVVDDGGDPQLCADDAVSCVHAAAAAHKEAMCAKGLDKCSAEDAPADKCATIEEKCALVE